MRSGGVLKLTVTACCAVAATVVVGAVIADHAGIGIGIAAGLLLGSLNGYLIEVLLKRGAPFLAASLLRLVLFSGIVLLAALTIGGAAWTVALGIGIAQLVMVGAGVRQGMRA
jgi:hypothetical protein